MFANRPKVRASVLALTIALASFTGCARSPQARRDKHVAAGRKMMEAKDYNRAILEFKTAVQAMPSDAESSYQLGMAYFASRDYQPAYSWLQRAVELNPRHREAQVMLGQLLAATRDPETIKEGQKRLMALAGERPDSQVLQSLALTELKLGQTQDAIQTLMQAVSRTPGELSVSLMLAVAKFSNGDVKGAEEALQQACANAPKSADPHIVLGEFYAARGRAADAETEFQRALELNPKEMAALFDLAKLQSATGRKKQAEESFRRLARSGDKAYASVHALFLAGEGRLQEAVPELESLAQKDPSDREARTRLIAAYMQVNRVADGQKLLDAALKRNPKDLEARLQRGELQLAAGKYAEAETDFTEVLRLKADSAEVHYALSKLRQARGEILSRRQELSEALRLMPGALPIRLELSELLIQSRDAKAAVDLLDAAPASQKPSLRLLERRNWALWALQKTAEMRKGVDRGLAMTKTSDLLIQDGLLKLQAQDLPAAQKSMEESLRLNPGNVPALEALYGIYVSRKASAAGLEKIREYAAWQPKSPEVQELLGHLLLLHGHPDEARAAFRAAKAANPQRLTADFCLVQVDVAGRKFDEARKRLQEILATAPKNAGAHLWLGILDQYAGDTNAAIEEYRKSLAQDANNTQALNNLAYLLTDRGKQVDEALGYAQKACELAPDEPTYTDTLGWILYRKGMYAMAVKHLARADSTKQNDPVVKYHLAMAYAKAGDLKSGRTTLEAARKLNPNLPEAQMAAGIVRDARQ